MTYQRVVNRNRLRVGGYNDAGDWEVSANLDHPGTLSVDEFHRVQFSFVAEEMKRREGGLRMLLGDLRRLEQDAVDEQATVLHIARRTGIDPEIVAAVLKEFMSW